jgi:hypothetical protein
LGSSYLMALCSDHLRLRHRRGIQEGLHRRLAKAPMASHERVQVNRSCVVLVNERFRRFGRILIVSMDPWLKPICIMRPYGRIASHAVAAQYGCTTLVRNSA